MTETMEQVDEPETETVPVTPETGDVNEDEDETGDVDEPEAEAAPEPESPVDEAAMEKFYKSLGTRTTTFNNWLSNELGEQANDLSPCPLCAHGIMGHIFPPDWTKPVDEIHARLLDVLKTPSAPEYRPAPHARRCGTCDGWGAVLSGSRLAGNDRVKCPTCNGLGYQGQGAPAPDVHSGNGVVAFEPPDDQTPLVTDDKDIWGSPRLLDDGQPNPNYGKMVQYKDPTLP